MSFSGVTYQSDRRRPFAAHSTAMARLIAGVCNDELVRSVVHLFKDWFSVSRADQRRHFK